MNQRKIDKNLQFDVINDREPSHQNDPVTGFQPVQNDAIHYLDINNDGLTTGLRPHQKAIDFWTKIEKKAFELAAELSKQSREES